MTNRVFILEKINTLNVNSADQFGTVHYLFDVGMKRCSVFKPADYIAAVLDLLRDKKFDPDIDLLCIAGGMIQNALAIHATLSFYGHLDVLMFSAQEDSYVKRRLEDSHGL